MANNEQVENLDFNELVTRCAGSARKDQEHYLANVVMHLMMKPVEQDARLPDSNVLHAFIANGAVGKICEKDVSVAMKVLDAFYCMVARAFLDDPDYNPDNIRSKAMEFMRTHKRGKEDNWFGCRRRRGRHTRQISGYDVVRFSVAYSSQLRVAMTGTNASSTDNQKDKIMKIKRSIANVTTLVAIGIVSVAGADTPTITGVTAQQRYPWNGKVDISYTVAGDIGSEANQRAVFTSLKVTVIDLVANTTNTATQLSGDLSLEEGTHSIVWDMNAERLSIKSSNVVFKVACETTNALYCVIDLSDGVGAVSYPVSHVPSAPLHGFNTDEYKTTKLVLRRLEAGRFIMGDDQNDESHHVTLTQPFFCGLFEVTQKQYTLVTGSNPSSFSGDALPVERVSYNAIRGSSNGANWPSSSAVDSSSFMGKLRTRTGLDFDLPTDAQWEYACRAGTTTMYSYGDSSDGNYMWYNDNSSSMPHPVGSKSANPWGLYDMHGNVFEWCLDWSGTLAYGTDPKGSSSGSFNHRVIRGGGWYYDAIFCTSSNRR